MRVDGFLVAMLTAVALALLWPEPGVANGYLNLGTLTQAGVALVFFTHGVMLAPQAIRAGLVKWRLHLLVQLTTFVAFPVFGVLLYWGTRAVLPDDLRLGFVLLCAMSSTISSSVAMTVLARGDVASAVFNATVSGLIGMLMTPMLVQLVTGADQHAVPLSEAITGILVTLAVPLVLGQLLRSALLSRLLPHRKWLTRLDRGVIVLIVYTSFCESTASGVWINFAWQHLALTALLSLALLVIMLGATRYVARAAGFSRAEEIAAVFCGSKKSLASGAPIAKIMFAGHPGLGLIMLPLMMYHQIQLLVCTVLARRYARAVE
jgi:solute carrier family 10 (sodium/bile acid cotransporter), member 7